MPGGCNIFTRCFLILVALCGLMSLPAHAQTTIPPSPIVTATLALHAPTVKKNQPVNAAVTFTIPEHWHIYWKNPGDSGLPTRLEWSMPDGLKAGDIRWPAPERIETTGLIDYGYSNRVTLLVPLTPTRDDITGEVAVKASWLVCKEVCIPESATLTALVQENETAATTIRTAQAQLPQPFDGQAQFTAAPDAVTLTLTRDQPWEQFSAARFSPAEDGVMANAPLGSVKHVGNELTFTLPRGTQAAPAQWNGILHLMVKGAERVWDVTAQNSAPATTSAAEQNPPAAPIAPPPSAPRTPLFTTLLFAFLGGLILNIMPCVLPILALKALALAKKAQAARAAAAAQGISYTAGVVSSFLLIAGVMLALKASGSAIGWGFQLQNAGFVAFLAGVMLLVAANLFGLFTLPVLLGARATGVDEGTLRGSFLTGGLAVMVATPCTAPFMATAIGATLTLPTAQALAVFAALGLGMASPFLLISLWPAARRLLPKPGAWMHRFKQLLALPMLATALWLLYVLAQLLSPTPPMLAEGRVAYSAATLSTLRHAGTPVLVDATAAWCLSCKVNERVALNPASMQQFFREQHVTLMVADWTNNDPDITAYLAEFGRNGVPLYVYYPPHGEPRVLPQILTPSLVREAITAPN